MSYVATQKLLSFIGEIDDSFLEEAELSDLVKAGRIRRKRITYGTSIVVVTGIAVATYWTLRKQRVARIA